MILQIENSRKNRARSKLPCITIPLEAMWDRRLELVGQFAPSLLSPANDNRARIRLFNYALALVTGNCADEAACIDPAHEANGSQGFVA